MFYISTFISSKLETELDDDKSNSRKLESSNDALTEGGMPGQLCMIQGENQVLNNEDTKTALREELAPVQEES